MKFARLIFLCSFLVFMISGCGEDDPVSPQQTEGDKYLAENAKKEGVIVTESGLQYEVMVQGDGSIPVISDSVTVHYEGKKIDGTVFDSSYERGEPSTFPVKRLIEGWVEALLMMKVGSKYRLVVPPDLAYGEYGAGSVIGPNEVLIFEMELLGIK